MNQKAVALVGGKGLGDNLIEMVLVHNAHLQGYATTVYSDVVCQLKDWFPVHRVLPSIAPERFKTELEAFGLVFWSGDTDGIVQEKAGQHWVDYMNHQVLGHTQVQNMEAVCRNILSCLSPVQENGIVPPDGLMRQRYRKRVCIHPTSAELSKNWLPRRFLKLAHQLAVGGYDPIFIMSKAEHEEWKPLIGDSFPLKGFENIADCAAFIYESGFFIGNDSGGGHLASCLNIPTLSIHGRRKKAILWQPGWGQVRVVTPPVNFIGNYLRQHYWKYLLTTSRVMRDFDRLAQSAG